MENQRFTSKTHLSKFNVRKDHVSLLPEAVQHLYLVEAMLQPIPELPLFKASV